MKLAVVTPVFEDAQAFGRLLEDLRRRFAELVVVAVDDGSVKEPLDVGDLARANVDGVVVRLRRNVGHQRAIAIGLSYAAAELADVDCIVVMDSDGEDVPNSIRELVVPLESPDVDVVVAQRRNRVETLSFRAFYQIYKRLFRVLTGRQISFGNFMAMKPAAAKRLAAMQELWTHVAASVLTSKLRVAACPLDRGPRYAGQSKMNFVGLALHGFRALMVFAEDVLLRLGVLCVAVAILALASGMTALLLRLYGFATPGWATVVIGVMLILFLQTGALTMMSLMLAGVMRGGSMAAIDYRNFIDRVLHVDRLAAR